MDHADVHRWLETRRKRRLLEGLWGVDLEQRLQLHFGLIRRGVMGPKTKSKNVYQRLCTELATLYGEPPNVRHGASGEVLDLLGPEGAITRAGLWPLMRRVQIHTLGCRESLVRVDWSSSLGRPTFRHVHADTVVATSRDDSPGNPYEVRELRWRSSLKKWCWDVLSIEDPTQPRYQVVLAEGSTGVGRDVTPLVLGGTFSGAAYPYRYQDGRPFLPYELYHADFASQLWDPYTWTELVDGALDVASAWTFWQHVVFRASWPQRYAVGAYVAGTTVEDTAAGQRQQLPADPTSLVHLQPMQGVQNAQVGQWAPAASPLELQQAIAAYEAGVSELAGVDGAHIVRDSGDAWSGAALSISRDGKREAQRVYGPTFRPSDLALIAKTAAVCNLATGSRLPEDGYRLTYKAIPLSPQELRERRDHNNELIDRGRMSSVQAYQDEHPGTTETEAEAELLHIVETEARLKAHRQEHLAPDTSTSDDDDNTDQAEA